MSRLREAMPETTAFVDAMREAFGEQLINDAISAGMQGQSTFWARENGIEVGQQWHEDPARTVSLADIDLKPFNPSPRRR